MQPILHLSIPGRDLVEAREFYVDTLGCEAARSGEGYQDVWFHGMQITLHDRPEEAAIRHPESVRHFGVALGREEFDVVIARLKRADTQWVSPVSTDNQGRPNEQTK